MDEVLLTLLDLALPSIVLPLIVKKDPFLAAQLAATIGAYENQREVQRKLVDALTDALESKTDQEAAVNGLVQLGESGVDALRSLLMHEHKWVRRSAVRSLARIGNRESVEAVVQALGDSHSWVRKDAAAALARLKDEARGHLEAYPLARPAPLTTERAGCDRRRASRLSGPSRNGIAQDHDACVRYF